MGQIHQQFTLLIAMVFSAGALAIPIEMDKASGKVEFLALVKPGSIKIKGKVPDSNTVTGKLDVTANTLKGDVTVKLDAFETGISLRDQHMKEKYLETAKFPTATLTLTPVPLTGDATKDSFKHEGPFEGTLTLHGVTKPVKGTTKLQRENGKLRGDFQFGVELDDYGIQAPEYLGVKVSKSVNVEASFAQ